MKRTRSDRRRHATTIMDSRLGNATSPHNKSDHTPPVVHRPDSAAAVDDAAFFFADMSYYDAAL